MSAAPDLNRSDWLSEFPPPRSLSLDQEALRIYEIAYYIGLSTEAQEEPPITFSTVAIALLSAEDETSRWFARLAQIHGPRLQAICDGKRTSPSALEGVERPVGKPVNIRLSSDKQLLTLSARSLLQTAEEWANRVGGSDIGVRHLVASYVLNPPAAHRKQMNDWGFKERDWRADFFTWVAGRYTAEAWTDASQKVAPTKAMAAFEKPSVKGEALAFPADPQAIAVLNRAAEYHARRTDTWLRMQTVFYALVEQARADVGVRDSIEPIWRAVQAAQENYKLAFDAYLLAPEMGRAAVDFDALDISPRVLNGLETARGLMFATRNNDNNVGVLQLAAALVSRRVDGDQGLIAAGLNPEMLRREMINHAAALGEADEVWREALGEEEIAPTGRTIDLNSDEPEAVIRSDVIWASDPLGIRPDVASFATLLASKSLEPPLSIGLFGPWGSGKTTFLKRLRHAIDERTGQPRESQNVSQPSPYVANVVHVEFNAWHFAEDALVSSLVNTIVRELRSFIKSDNPTVGAALERIKSETAEGARRKLESQRQREATTRAAVETAKRSLHQSEVAARDGLLSIDSAVRGTWTAVVNSVRSLPTVKDSGIADKLGATIKDLEDLRSRSKAIQSRPARLVSELGWPRTLLFAGMVLALPIAVGWLVTKVLGSGEATSTIASLSAALSAIGIWIKTASGAVSKVDQAIDEVIKEYERQIDANPNVQNARVNLDKLKAEAAQAAEKLAAAEQELRVAESEAAAASLPNQILTLVTSRVDDKSYSKELTTVSVAREDLQTLSGILRDQIAGASEQPGLRPVDRVILYIDDLDRCRPEDVVRVLQVVHMLLAFELFVVVVAVDARWVEESLKQSYRWLESANTLTSVDANAQPVTKISTHITPQDYLEKIFQISFWLEPMTAARAAEYLKSLVRAAPRESDSEIGSPPGEGSSRTGSTSTDSGKVDILSLELDYMRALAAYVGPSPRRVKRLVNAYRLLKARLSDAQLKNFLTDRTTDDGLSRSGPYQLVIGLLVIGTGAGTSGAIILAELAERDPRDRLDAVIDSFRERQHADWTMSAQVLETLMRTQRPNDISELRGWARKVGRFLLLGTAEFLRTRSTSP